MRYFPIFVDLADRRVVVAGAGNTAVPKVRLLLKTQARIEVYGTDPHDDILHWHKKGKIVHVNRFPEVADIRDSTLVYGASADLELDQKVLAMGREAGAWINIVDNLELSQFITPAIVDRDPITVAIGTEGTAPVLARKIKSMIEDLLPAFLGAIAQYSATFRNRVARILPSGEVRHMWSNFFDKVLDPAFSMTSKEEIKYEVESSIGEILSRSHQVARLGLIEYGSGELSDLPAESRNLIEDADVVLIDNDVPKTIVELVRREADLVNLDQLSADQNTSKTAVVTRRLNRIRPGQTLVLLGSGASKSRLDAWRKMALQFGSGNTSCRESGVEVELVKSGKDSERSQGGCRQTAPFTNDKYLCKLVRQENMDPICADFGPVRKVA